MNRLISSIALSLLAVALSAANIDGKWSFETEIPEGKAKRAGRSFTTTLDLKSQGDKLTGTVMLGRGRRLEPVEIENGKIEGDKFSFTTTLRTQRGEVKIEWRGTVTENELSGTQSRGGRKGIPFTAKRVS